MERSSKMAGQGQRDRVKEGRTRIHLPGKWDVSKAEVANMRDK